MRPSVQGLRYTMQPVCTFELTVTSKVTPNRDVHASLYFILLCMLNDSTSFILDFYFLSWNNFAQTICKHHPDCIR
jgi:hypothetical protein